MSDSIDFVQTERLHYHPPLPSALQSAEAVAVRQGFAGETLSDETKRANAARDFPNASGANFVELVAGGAQKPTAAVRIGVVLSGKSAPGGHNIVAGLFDAVKALSPASSLVGFRNGSEGLVKNDAVEITQDFVDRFRNTGGYFALGFGRVRLADNVKARKQIQETAEANKLDGIVLVGGPNTFNDALYLAEHFLANKCSTRVVAIPAAMDKSVGSKCIETTIGFDTSCRAISHAIGNIAVDCRSSKKYWFFIRLMGRKPSHTTLECALQTHPNLAFIGEEVEEKKMSLADLKKLICDVICARSAQGNNYGLVLLPEGLFEFVPELAVLFRELNQLFVDRAKKSGDASKPEEAEVVPMLSPWSREVFLSLPERLRHQLIVERDVHQEVDLSSVETEVFVRELVEEELNQRRLRGEFGGKFSSLTFFFGYQARGAAPSNFDVALAESHAHTAVHLIHNGVSGVSTVVRYLSAETSQWRCGAEPLWSVHHISSNPESLPYVPVDSVSTQSRPFEVYKTHRKIWKTRDVYRNPGPIQYVDTAGDDRCRTLQLGFESYASKLERVAALCDSIRASCRPGSSERFLDATIVQLEAIQHLHHILHAAE